MSFKKTITFTATVSDYTDGTVTARVQAENKILGDFITWILSHNLNLSLQEHIEIGSSQWAGKPLYCSTSGYSGVDSNSTTSDFYVIGKGKAKKCLGFSVDQHRLFFGLTDTVEKDLSYSMYNSAQQESYGRIPAAQMRRDNNQNIRDVKIASTGQIWGWNFSQADNDINLTVSFWKSEKTLAILIDNGGNTSFLILSKDPSTCFYAYNKELQGLHFSFDDEFLISDATYGFDASNNSYSSNIYLGYAMSFNPFYARSQNVPMFSSFSRAYYPTCILCHIVGAPDNQLTPSSSAVRKITQPQNGLATDSYMPTQTGYGFPRIANNELYIRKMYVPMTYPAVVSPLKIGYTPGTLRCGTVYSLADKYYLCLTNGVIGHFVEVADQGD